MAAFPFVRFSCDRAPAGTATPAATVSSSSLGPAPGAAATLTGIPEASGASCTPPTLMSHCAVSRLRSAFSSKRTTDGEPRNSIGRPAKRFVVAPIATAMLTPSVSIPRLLLRRRLRGYDRRRLPVRTTCLERELPLPAAAAGDVWTTARPETALRALVKTKVCHHAPRFRGIPRSRLALSAARAPRVHLRVRESERLTALDSAPVSRAASAESRNRGAPSSHFTPP